MTVARLYERLMTPGSYTEPPDLAHIAATDHMDDRHGQIVFSIRVCSKSMMASFQKKMPCRIYILCAVAGDSIRSV